MERQNRYSYEFGPFRIDPVKRLLLRDRATVALTPKAFDILLVLIEHSGQVLDKDELLKLVWPNTVVEENNLTRNVSTLRKVLGEGPHDHNYIVTIPGEGYRFVASVRELEDEDADLVLEKHTKARVLIEEETEGSLEIFEQRTHFTRDRTQRWNKWTPRLTFLLSGALTLGLIGVPFYLWFSSKIKGSETGPEVRSVAVLPFKSMGEDGDESLKLGMADALITRLSNAKQIIVQPTSAVLKYAGQGQDPLDAGRLMQVDSVLEGSVQKSGDRVRVTVQLVRVRDGRSLWAEKFDEQWTNIFAVQDSISQQVSQALMLKLTSEERERLTKRYTDNSEAYQLYLWGRYFWNKRTEEGFKKAIGYFEQAIAKDHSYALAYAGLADCYNLLSSYYMLPQKETYPKAKAAAAKALQMDDTLAEAHASLGWVRLNYDWDWSGAEREFKRALELNPNYVTAHQWYAWQLMLMGRFDESLAEMKRARQLDPLSLAINTDAGLQLYYMHQYDQAIEQYQKTLEMDPSSANLHLYFALACFHRGLYEKAFAEQEKWIALTGGTQELVAARRNELAALKGAYAASGGKGFWEKELDLAKRRTNQDGPAGMAAFYAKANEKEQALKSLEQAYREREEMLLYLKVDPYWDNLRSESRFIDLMQRIGLTP